MIFAIPYQPFNAIPIGPITIYMWGIMVAIAFLVGTYFAVKEAKRRGMNVDKIYNLLILIIVGALIGSRIFYFIFYRHEGAAIGLIDFFKVWEGGLSFFGGFVGAFAVGTWYILRTKMGFWRTADLLAPSIAIGHAIGRVGCYLTGLHTGKLTTVPWGIAVDGAVRHSTPMYEFIGLTIIFFILMNLRKKEKFEKLHGFLFSSYLIGYGVIRFISDFFRADDPTYIGLTLAQYIAIAIFVFGVGYLAVKAKKHKV